MGVSAGEKTVTTEPREKVASDHLLYLFLTTVYLADELSEADQVTREVAIQEFLQDNPTAKRLTAQDNFEDLFDQGWRRYSIYPEVLLPAQYFLQQSGPTNKARTDYFLVIHCQVTGERLHAFVSRHLVVHPETQERLFVGDAGRDFAVQKGWQE